MFSSIVVAVDGSSHSLRALAFAAELAATNEAELGIIYVVESRIFGLPGDLSEASHAGQIIDPSPNLFSNLESFRGDTVKSISEASSESYRLAMQLAEHIVDNAERNASVDGAEKITTLIATGNVVDKILEFAAQRKADVIISGRRGMGAIKAVLLGSTSTKLAHSAPCTTIIVK